MYAKRCIPHPRRRMDLCQLIHAESALTNLMRFSSRFAAWDGLIGLPHALVLTAACLSFAPYSHVGFVVDPHSFNEMVYFNTRPASH